MAQNSCDVLIVGGGPAGLASAIALRMQGADVVVVDALKPPIDKACGEGLMPDARRALTRLGIECRPDDGALFHGIRFMEWSGRETISASADFASGKGIGMRRTVLHTRMMDRALDAGVRLRWNTRAALGSSVRLNEENCQFRYLVGADGQSSKVRKWAGLDACRLRTKRFGFRRHYRIAPFSSYVEVHWCALGQVYITPIAEDEICIAVVTRNASIRMRQVIAAIPELQERLSVKDAITDERGALTTSRKLQCVARSNIALVGDASGSVDAITGEGLSISFRQANLLAQSLEKDSLELYAAEHEKTLQRSRRMSHALLMMDRYSLARRTAMHILAESPELFSELLRAHVEEEKLPYALLRTGTAVMKCFADPDISASDTERVST